MQQMAGPPALPQVVDGYRFLGVEGPLQQRFEHRRQLLEPVRAAGQAEAVHVPASFGVPVGDHSAGCVQDLQRPAE